MLPKLSISRKFYVDLLSLSVVHDNTIGYAGGRLLKKMLAGMKRLPRFLHKKYGLLPDFKDPESTFPSFFPASFFFSLIDFVVLGRNALPVVKTEE
jgi:hypothetical protein